MDVHERFYGMALDEMNSSGERRHDLWAKAMALSAGEQTKTDAIYLDLLARFYAESTSRQDNQAIKLAAFEIAITAGKKGKRLGYILACWGLWLAVNVVLIAAVVNISDVLYKKYVLYAAIHAEPAQGNWVPRQFFDAAGKRFTEPTLKEYYQARVVRETGIQPPGLSQIALDSAYLDTTQLLMKYGYQGGMALMSSNLQANTMFNNIRYSSKRDYMAAVDNDPVPWLLLALAWAGLVYAMTRVTRKWLRR